MNSCGNAILTNGLEHIKKDIVDIHPDCDDNILNATTVGGLMRLNAAIQCCRVLV